MKWKVGDELMVRVRVISADSEPGLIYPYIIEYGSGYSDRIPELALTSATLIERPLAVGDSVEWWSGSLSACRATGIIVDIEGKTACIRRTDGRGPVWREVFLSELRRAEPA